MVVCEKCGLPIMPSGCMCDAKTANATKLQPGKLYILVDGEYKEVVSIKTCALGTITAGRIRQVNHGQ